MQKQNNTIFVILYKSYDENLIFAPLLWSCV